MEGETNAAASKSQQAGLAGSRDFYRSEQESSGSDEYRADRNPLGLPSGPVSNPFMSPDVQATQRGGE
jgi:hypothetical protein